VPGLRGTRPGAVPQVPHLFYYDLTTLEWLLGRAGWALADGDEQISAVFRRGTPRDVDLAGNRERNLAAAKALP
jgi:hypothetical protein